MGEKIAPAATSAEPRRGAPESGLPRISGYILSPNSTIDSTDQLSAENVYLAHILDQVIENAPEAISIVDQDAGILRINREFTRLFGFTSEEVAGKSLSLLIVPPDRSAETAWITHCLSGQTHVSLETRRQRKDGLLIDVLLSSSPITLNGQRIGACASYRDITERKRAEELNTALYAIAARSQAPEDLDRFFAAIHHILGQLMNARNFYISLYDPQSQLLSFPYFVDESESAPAARPLGRGLTEYVLRSGEPLLATSSVFQELVASGQVELIGAPSLDWLGVPLKSGNNCIGVLVVQSYHENVRFGDREREILKFVSHQLAGAIEHKRYEEALRRSEARSRSLILSAAFGICRCTLSGRFLDVNPALIGMLGRGIGRGSASAQCPARRLCQPPRVRPNGRGISPHRKFAGSRGAVEAQGRPHDHRALERLRGLQCR